MEKKENIENKVLKQNQTENKQIKYIEKVENLENSYIFSNDVYLDNLLFKKGRTYILNEKQKQDLKIFIK